MRHEVLEHRMQQVLHDKKWKVFRARSWPWRYLPFVECVLAAGSMATGAVHAHSDFDVIVAAKKGRIFTARFFSVLLLGLLGWRRPKLSHKDAANNKLCLNHFVTKASYTLEKPWNSYWQNLYRHLVPVFGDADKVNAFFAANKELMNETRIYHDDLRHVHRASSSMKRWLEERLRGAWGNRLEQFLKRIQIARIEKSLHHDPPGHNPRIRYSDDELEFHPDTRRIELYATNSKSQASNSK